MKPLLQLPVHLYPDGKRWRSLAAFCLVATVSLAGVISLASPASENAAASADDNRTSPPADKEHANKTPQDKTPQDNAPLGNDSADMGSVGRRMDAFSLPDLENRPITIEPSDAVNATVVCFLGIECPLAKLYASRLSAMSRALSTKGVRFVAVDSNRQDTLPEIRTFASKYPLRFPLLKDYGNAIADQFQAERTPEVFVLDRAFVVRYQGRIDNQYEPGISRPKPTTHALRTAIDQLIAGQSVSVPRTRPEGCLIGRVRPSATPSTSATDGTAPSVTYCKDIAPMLQTHCVSCHRSGEIGPFVLDDYDEVVGWADMMLEVIEQRRMPPWHANPEFGTFRNARHMPESDIQRLRDWIATGTAYGDADDLPDPPEHVTGWRLPGTPDVVVSMGERPFQVPAEGTVDYQYFVVDPGFKEDKWVTAAEVVPGDSTVVHHSIVFVRPPDGEAMRGFGWLGAYVPGQQCAVYPMGVGQRIPAGSKLVFQQHYTPNGRPAEDLTRIGLIFGEESEITNQTYTLLGIDQKFEIPPHAKQTVVTCRVRHMPKHGKLLAISPHMHLRGKSFRLTRHQGQQSQILLDVPNYDFNWQHAYQLVKPMDLETIDELACEFVFDNSPANPFNPNPNEFVMWGDQTDEEMAVAFFQVSEPRHTPSPTSHPTASDVVASGDSARASDSNANADEPSDPPKTEEQKQAQTERRKRLAATVDAMIESFDANGDGQVSKSETPWIFRRYQFGNLDSNHDAILTREEIEQAAQWHVN